MGKAKITNHTNHLSIDTGDFSEQLGNIVEGTFRKAVIDVVLTGTQVDVNINGTLHALSYEVIEATPELTSNKELYGLIKGYLLG